MLIALTLVTFAEVVRCGFIDAFDDAVYVTENPIVQKGLTSAGMMWAFTVPYFFTWHPLAWVSHMLDSQLFGLNFAGRHATSLVLHIANTLLLFIFLHRATGALWRSWLFMPNATKR
jgi:hypothetical protein